MPALAKVHPHASAAQAAFHADTVAEVRRAVESQKVVVVGMAWNPNVSRARRILTEKGVTFTYLEYGNYLSGWKKRLAIKLWSGWPTFPQIFVDGVLIGGCSDMVALTGKGELTLP
jgi:glutaredoxin-related protein